VNVNYPISVINLKTKKMKTLNFDLFEMYLLTNEEMKVVRGGDDGEPTPMAPPPPIKLEV